jgi:hypothetical protein
MTMTIQELKSGGFKAVLDRAIVAAGLTDSQATLARWIASRPGTLSHVEQPVGYVDNPGYPHDEAVARLADVAAAAVVFSNAVSAVHQIVSENPGAVVRSHHSSGEVTHTRVFS